MCELLYICCVLDVVRIEQEMSEIRSEGGTRSVTSAGIVMVRSRWEEGALHNKRVNRWVSSQLSVHPEATLCATVNSNPIGSSPKLPFTVCFCLYSAPSRSVRHESMFMSSRGKKPHHTALGIYIQWQYDGHRTPLLVRMRGICDSPRARRNPCVDDFIDHNNIRRYHTDRRRAVFMRMSSTM